MHGLVGSPYKTGYVAAKHRLLGLVEVLALECAERGISVSAVCPSFVRTRSSRRRSQLGRPRVTGAPLVMDLGWTAR